MAHNNIYNMPLAIDRHVYVNCLANDIRVDFSRAIIISTYYSVVVTVAAAAAAVLLLLLLLLLFFRTQLVRVRESDYQLISRVY